MTNNSKTNKLTHYAAEIDSPSGNHIWDVRILFIHWDIYVSINKHFADCETRIVIVAPSRESDTQQQNPQKITKSIRFYQDWNKSHSA